MKFRLLSALLAVVAGCGTNILGQNAVDAAVNRCVELGNNRTASIALANSMQDAFNRGFTVAEMNALIVNACGRDLACSECGLSLSNAIR